MNFRKKIWFLVVLILFITLSHNTLATENEEIDLQLTLATPGHKTVQQPDVHSTNIDKPKEGDQPEKDEQHSQEKRKKRTKAEMANVDKKELRKQQYRESGKRHLEKVYSDANLLKNYRARKRRNSANTLKRIKQDPKKLKEYKIKSKLARDKFRAKKKHILDRNDK